MFWLSFSAGVTHRPHAGIHKCTVLLPKCVLFSLFANTNLWSESGGDEGPLSATTSSVAQVSGLTSIQDPTAIVKVEAGIGMVT